ncbi:Hypothetical predicted protein [Paramuricea clavata]|nr:Hypothetical predicted protein [Paramuricea clavata]
MPANRPPYNMNANINFGGRSQTDTVMSKLSSQLDQADQSELQELHDKEEKVHQLLNENSEVKQVQAEREMQLAGNRSLAEYNMSQGSKLAECKSRLTNLYEQLNEQTVKFDENKQNLDYLSDQYNPDTIMALLQTSVAQLEENSEKTADGFLDGEVTVEDFLEKYVKERAELHVRRTKVDKLKELMTHRNVLTTS